MTHLFFPLQHGIYEQPQSWRNNNHDKDGILAQNFSGNIYFSIYCLVHYQCGTHMLILHNLSYFICNNHERILLKLITWNPGCCFVFYGPAVYIDTFDECSFGFNMTEDCNFHYEWVLGVTVTGFPLRYLYNCNIWQNIDL